MDAVDPLLSPHSSKRSSFPPISLSSVHVAQALQQSSDKGATLVFSKMNIYDIGSSAAEQLGTLGREMSDDESVVKRIALGNNHLTTLPMELALLSRLRYLNLRHNNFSAFPDVLTSMPSLDTLDISHNKIKRLPSQAGHLVHLRVFCCARNKISRLPSYLSQFYNLEVLQVERNPIEWPPTSVMENGSNPNSRHAMKDWVQNLRQWMEVDMRQTRGFSEQQNLDTYIEESYSSWRFPRGELASVEAFTPHSRSFSTDSSFSMLSVSEPVQYRETSTSMNDETDRPPPLHLGMLGTFSAENSPTRSLTSYLPSPVDSEFLEDSRSAGLNPTESLHHGRNASYGSDLPPATRSNVVNKKSMPDLRTAKLGFSKKIADIPDASSIPTIRDRNHDNLSTLSPLPIRHDSGSTLSSDRVIKPSSRDTTRSSPTRAVSSMAFERNSYFQRLSTLPTTTALPKPLICLVDSARSILFAVCQVYQTLEHYMIHAIDDRISSVLRKVLDPASTDVIQLINSLDRFDSMSRKMLPSPAICRAVVEGCRDTVAVFNKAIGVLALQLKVIITGDDMRYSRWILLELYGATFEVSCAWQTMIPQIENIKPLLRAKGLASQPPPVANTAGLEAHPTLSIASALPMDPSVSLRPQQGLPGSLGNVERVRTARRHAGSFSSKDVEIGKKLPSYDDVPGLLGGIASGVAKNTPTLRAPKRQATVPLTTISSPSPTTPLSLTQSSASTFTSFASLREGSRPSHSRQGSQTSLRTSASSSPSVPSKTNFLDLPSNSKSQVDREALQAVQAAIEVAPAVWDMIAELFGDALDSKTSVWDTIKKARIVTAKLSKRLQTLHDPEAFVDRKDLSEDAHAFLKIVVQLCNIIKTYRGPHIVSSSLRTGMVKLTNSTEEFAILLHVSSFSPSTPRSHTPILNVSTGKAGPDELRLGSSLSRSRSAQPSTNFNLLALAPQDGPRSALSAQSFKIPGIKPLQSRENLDNRATSPG